MFTGDPDTLIRIGVDGLQHLEQVINNLRKNVLVIGTQTLMIFSF